MWKWAFVILGVVFFAGCDAPGGVCLEGRVVTCPCSGSGEVGQQKCAPGGSWSACVCAGDAVTRPDFGADDGVDSWLDQEEDAEDDVGPIPSGDTRFVRIDDLSDEADTLNGGADIDAVVLLKANGDFFYADNVEGFVFGSGFAETLDPNEALGAPDAFYAFHDGDLTVCSIAGGVSGAGRFVSLGGEGGSLIVRMAGVIEMDDFLAVLEVGGCEYEEDGGGMAIVEEVKVSVSVSSSYDGQWVVLGKGEGPLAGFLIEDLP